MLSTLLRSTAAALCLILAFVPVGYSSDPSIPALALEQALRAPAALLMDANTGAVLLARNEHEARPVASLTKLMTMLLVFEAEAAGRVKWEDTVAVSAHAAGFGGSQIWLETGETLTLEELFLSVAIESANDSAVALAEFVAGSEEGFVALMNERARALGMANTHFTSASGLDLGSPHSSAMDMALLSREILRHQQVHEFVTIRTHELTRARTRTTLTNTNRDLLAAYLGYDGLKTGWTRRAGHCLASTAKRGDLRLVAIVLGATSSTERRSDIVKLLDYGFANYEGRRVVKEGQVVGEVPIAKGTNQVAEAVAASDLYLLLAKGHRSPVETRTELLRVAAPIVVGQTLGRLWVTAEGQEPVYVLLVAKTSVARASWWQNFRRMWESLLPVP